MPEFVGIELTKPLPATAVVDSTYKTEGSVKLFDALGAPPFVYAEVKHKEWYKPEWAEETKHNRGWPAPISGKFTIEFKPEKEGDYEVTIVATPAPLALPAVGVFPILAKSDVMKVAVGQKPPAVFRFSGVTIDGNKVPLGNHDADSKLLIQKKVTDTLEIIPSYEWVGASKTATISIKAGYKDLLGNFTPKTDAYTRNIELPESPDTPYSGVLEEAITIPLTACGDLDDGAIEIVAKLPDMGDYITQVWNVYATKAPVVNFRFSAIDIDGNTVQLTDHDADSGLLLPKTTADSLSINPAFEWQGPRKSATISIKAGYKDWTGGFTPKSGAYTRSIELPESIETVYPGHLTSPISVPLTACGGLTDGALEVVLKISGVSDYITHIWNVYITGEIAVVTKQSIVYNSNQSNINSGQAINVQITWKNTGTASITPRFRVDIEGTGLFDSPLEGQWVTSPAGSPGQVVTVNASSIPIPTDWQNGKTLHAYVMLDGVSGHWDESTILFTVVKGAGGVLSASYSGGVVSYSFSGFQANATVTLTVTQTGGSLTATANSSGAGSGSFYDSDPAGTYTLQATDGYGHSATASFTVSGAGIVTKQSVVYNNNQTNVTRGQPVSVQITWKNTGPTSIQPRFRVDIEGTGLLDSPLEGQWVTSPAGTPGQVVTVNASSIPIPTDWQNGKTLHAYVMLDGVSGHWDESGLLTVVVSVASSLSASYSAGVVDYSFSGFQANATVTLTVLETGGYVTQTANSSGAGSGSFNDTDPAGTYTLQATDSYGHSATATFTITGGGGAPALVASYSGGIVSYVFTGFQPYMTVTLTVTQTGGSITAQADSSGSGSGIFGDNDPAGTYTLGAVDDYGHSATATFVI